MNGLGEFLLSSITMALISLMIEWHSSKKRKIVNEEDNKLDEKVLSCPESSWKKVGKIKNIYYYPLKSGKGKSTKQCKFEKFGISIDEPEFFTIKDRMFVVCDERTGKFQTGRQYPNLLLVNIFAIDKERAKLQADGMPNLVFYLPKITDKNAKIIEFSMWWNEPMKCLDCGSEASEWLSKFLIGSGSDLKLGIWLPDHHRNVTKGVWKQHAKIYNRLRDDYAGLFADLASYMLMSESSVNDLNERLKKPISILQLRPNIVVESSCTAYAEDEWKWIKIGSTAVIHNFKPCTRCLMVRIDPHTGIPDSQSEPLKTLRTYRKLKNVEMNKFENYAPAIGIYCGLYRSGEVQLGDDVYVYQPNDII